MSQIYDILQGWGRAVQSEFVELPEDVQKRSQLRLSICDTCYMRSNKVCSKQKTGQNVITGEVTPGCGCFLSKKALADNSRCPLGKWEFAFESFQKIHQIEKEFAEKKAQK